MSAIADRPLVFGPPLPQGRASHMPRQDHSIDATRPLAAVHNARKALAPDAPLIRDDKEGQTDNLASATWEAGDEDATERAFAEAHTIVASDIIYPRCHPTPLETCGMI